MLIDILEKNKDISDLSNYKTPAIAKFYFEINTDSDLEKLSSIYKYSKKTGLGFLIIGGGTNLLFSFDVFQGIVIKNNLNGWSYDTENQMLSSYTNEPISDIALGLEAKYNQTIWHRFIGLPGSVGGAVFGNAGCFGLETENNFSYADVYDMNNGEILQVSKEQMDFEYRSSKIKKQGHYFIIRGYFDLSKVIEKYRSDVDNIEFREKKQPKGNTCGSFFKNPSVNHGEFLAKLPEYIPEFENSNKKISAGFLLENSNMKGYRHNTAFFSDKHANFLMNDYKGKSSNLTELISIAQNKVKNKFGIDLVPEVRIIKNEL